jgi:hypothetical protein
MGPAFGKGKPQNSVSRSHLGSCLRALPARAAICVQASSLLVSATILQQIWFCS